METAETAKTLRRLMTGALVVGSVAIAGCGSNSSTTTSSSTSAPAASATSSAPAPATSSATTSSGSGSSGIPQGPTAGDRDSDNNGGPSDGDGNV